ncbi:MAG: efflux RND transporter periplasmic adaptor subunit [Smithella sp.]
MEKHNRYRMIIPFLLIVIALFTFATTGCKSKKEEPVKRPVISDVKIEPVTVSAVDDVYEVTGTVKSTLTSIVAGRVMGVVTSIHVKEGDFVRRGQLLATLDDRDAVQRVRAASMAVESAKQNQSLAEKTWQRYKELYGKDVISRQEMDQVETQKKVADSEYKRIKAAADEAETNLSFTRVAAPISGRISEKRIDEGSMATPGIPLLVIEGGEGAYIEVSIDAGVGNSVKTGMSVEAIVETENRPLAGIIKEVFPSIDPVSRTFTAKIGFKNARPRSGLFARVRIPIGRRDAIVVPDKAIVRKGQLNGVYAVDDQGLVTYRLVRTGKVFAQGTEILSGLKVNDRIITTELEQIIDGGVIKGEEIK